MSSVYLQDLSWVKAEEMFRRIPTLLVPIGAILKEHGPHLPLKTDFTLAAKGARRFCLLNTGVSTTGPLLVAANNLAARGLSIILANIVDLGRAADHVLENPVGTHANEHETSLGLAIDPSW